ncbi:hypothetical protein [Parvibaculum sp.]|uniref:hypothetical protein n=1 Tax=Parvibaculum sp. TaxID=2024848 RepID=UPI001D3B3D20|nr:hypothetical protein [Parvibaculum sp.]MBX3490990.1 hypothetical protein [Parvibaculum sp.]MCW5728816.1 hypothetical protein [Parvibaculum sp.]
MPAALPRLWIDGAAFGARVLRGGDDPWDAPGELGLFLRELSALLALEIVDIDIGAGIAAFARAQGTGPLDAGAIEDLLSDAALRAHLKRGIETVSGALSGRPLALALPGPGALAQAFMDEGDIDDNALDDLAMALADLLRALIAPSIGVLRFTEADPRALEFFEPLTNIARHYELPAVLVMAGVAADVAGFNRVYGSSPAATGEILGPAFWEGGDVALRDDTPVFTEVPSALVPETALAKIRVLNESAS